MGRCFCLGGITGLILAWIHRWRRPRSFFLLLGWSFLGFVVGVVLHNALWAVVEMKPGLPPWVVAPLETAHVVAFLVAVLVCPPAVLVGLVGWLVTNVRERHLVRQGG